ncbi:MAG: glycoside hydrolase family 5 protein [Planctomycetes bacterium]|nr:glycoside hydrolase family 5 protein [Planctomycetota bacterium]
MFDTPRRGANYVLADGDPTGDFRDAKSYRMNLLRLFVPGVPRGWPDQEDYFTSERFDVDLAGFDAALAKAASLQLPVVVVGGSVPGRQWLWTTHERGDQRLWRNPRWHEALAEYWGRLARRYRDHPAVVAYELLNEPHPEATEEREQWSRAELQEFSRKVPGTPADLNLVYRRAVAAVRDVDRETPIVLDSSLWASPATFASLTPIAGDDHVLYSFHWYEPGEYTVWRTNRGALSYPGCVTLRRGDDGSTESVKWNRAAHRRLMVEPIREWQRRTAVPSNRILCGEFSADRRAPGADQWNAEVLALLEENGWHWTYYAFRESDWNAKDFELGPDAEARTRSAGRMMKTFADAMSRNRP